MAREWYSSGDSSETACSYFFHLENLTEQRSPTHLDLSIFNFGGVNGQPRRASDGRNLANDLECTTPP